MKILSKINDFLEKDYKSSVLSGTMIISPYRFVAAGWTFQTTFDNITGWTGVSGAFSHTTDKISFDADTSLSHMYYDLTTVSDTAWVTQFPLLLSTATEGGALQQIYWGIKAGTGDLDSSNDNVAFGMRYGEGACSNYRNAWGNEASVRNNIDAYTTAIVSGNYGIQLIRTSSTNIEGKLMNSIFSTTTETNNTTIDSTITGLRYLWGGTINEGTNTNLIGSITSWKFANGVTVPPI